VRHLTAPECTRLVNATDPAFRQMVRAALLTGCRYGELTALRVADFNPDAAGTLSIRNPKSGKPRRRGPHRGRPGLLRGGDCRQGLRAI